MKAAGVILAGGKSSRMGEDKSMLEFHGETLISRSVRELRGYVEELIVVSNRQQKYCFPGVKEITDIYRGIGPLAGIHAGLKAAAFEYVFFMACDMPFLEGRLAGMLLENSPGFDVVVPRIGSYLEPLCAVYSKTCLPYIENNIAKKCCRVIDFYPFVKVKYIEEKMIRKITDPKQAFVNINTQDEYRKMCPLVQHAKN